MPDFTRERIASEHLDNHSRKGRRDHQLALSMSRAESLRMHPLLFLVWSARRSAEPSKELWNRDRQREYALLTNVT